MHNFLVKHHLKEKEIAVAVSGGADSLALALMAREELAVYGYKIVALTVNHGLRASAAKEAEYVAKVMASHNIEHHILTWKGQKPCAGIEEAARLARYDLLTGWCKEHNIKLLMVAHHLYDQAETFLMRLQRGSGLEGLCAMREVSERQGVKILRPLLYTNPEELKIYLQKKNIEWIEDESNKDKSFLRNKIRAFLPIMEAEIGVTPQKICEAVSNLQSAEEFIENRIAAVFERQVQKDFATVYSFKYGDYLTWPREIKFRIISELCRRVYIPRAEAILNTIELLDKQPFNGLTLGGKEIFGAYGRIWIVPEMQAKHKASRKQWKEFTQTHQEYQKKKIPHKARIAILCGENKS
ncbi:MAG: tRNA lysidine(34) synthetase TilS [Alphaproteobacteria bacterium]|nr:tRNA lysidine(34) synthetase TilS [Alphaproteobacteria bacterium]